MPWVSAIVLLPLLGALSMLSVPEAPRRPRQARIQALGVGRRHRRAHRDPDRPVRPQRPRPAVHRPRRLGRGGRPVVGRRRGRHLDLAARADGRGLPAGDRSPPAGGRRSARARSWRCCCWPSAGLLGLFAAGQLVLFYVFWEAMLIPFYFLIGMWGGAGRGRANTHVRDLHDGRQPADAGRDPGHGLHRAGHHRAVHLPDPRPGGRRLHRHPEHLAVPRLRAGVRDQAAPLAVPRLAAGRVPRRADPGDRAAGRGDEQGRRLRPPAHRPAGVPGGRRPLRHPDRGARGGRHRLRVARRVARSPRCAAWWPTRASPTWASSRSASWRSTSRRRRAPCSRWSTTASWSLAAFAIVGVINRAAPDDRIDGIGGLADGAPRMAGVFLIVAMAALAIPGSNTFVGEFFILTGVFRQHLWLAVLACIGIAYAAVYMLRLYQSTMNGPRRGDAARRRAARRRPDGAAAPGRGDAVHRAVAEGPRGRHDPGESSRPSRPPRSPRTARPTRSGPSSRPTRRPTRSRSPATPPRARPPPPAGAARP